MTEHTLAAGTEERPEGARADRSPTPDEERAADDARSRIDVGDVGEHYEEMAERGAHAKGEGQIEPDANS